MFQSSKVATFFLLIVAATKAQETLTVTLDNVPQLLSALAMDETFTLAPLDDFGLSTFPTAGLNVVVMQPISVLATALPVATLSASETGGDLFVEFYKAAHFGGFQTELIAGEEDPSAESVTVE
ncbi:hypothetical protein FB45DRAFT_1092870 [Roridomyces roridus]|uniref:Uncharacterized protein n=1 Tax=Roridomyces roridus TaxID=1738132 RepID=A0AAD7FI28_9AGAR|nr:hypothetical protein FB45DRAFT_1092870 [Roridomyces roridus]